MIYDLKESGFTPEDRHRVIEFVGVLGIIGLLVGGIAKGFDTYVGKAKQVEALLLARLPITELALNNAQRGVLRASDIEQLNEQWSDHSGQYVSAVVVRQGYAIDMSYADGVEMNGTLSYRLALPASGQGPLLPVCGKRDPGVQSVLPGEDNTTLNADQLPYFCR